MIEQVSWEESLVSVVIVRVFKTALVVVVTVDVRVDVADIVVEKSSSSSSFPGHHHVHSVSERLEPRVATGSQMAMQVPTVAVTVFGHVERDGLLGDSVASTMASRPTRLKTRDWWRRILLREVRLLGWMDAKGCWYGVLKLER